MSDGVAATASEPVKVNGYCRTNTGQMLALELYNSCTRHHHEVVGRTAGPDAGSWAVRSKRGIIIFGKPGKEDGDPGGEREREGERKHTVNAHTG